MISGAKILDLDKLFSNIEIKAQLATKLRMLLRGISGRPFKMGDITSLRVNQLSGLEKLAAFLEDPDNDDMEGFFTQATGAGKTILFSIIIRLLSEPTIIFVPRIDLIEQTCNALQSVGFSREDIGIYGGGERTVGLKILIATYHSHIFYSQREGPYKNFLSRVKLVVCDEAHRSLGSKTRAAIETVVSSPSGTDLEDLTEEADQNQAVELLDTQLGKRALKLGFTATPRLAAKAVSEHFGKEIAHDGVVDMIAAGVLCEFRLEQVNGEILANTELSHGRITNELEVKILSRNRVYEKLLETFDRVYKKMMAEGCPPRTIVSCSNIAEANSFLDMAKARGYRAEVYTSRDPDALTRKLQAAKKIRLEAAMRKGDLDMIVTVDKLSEGWDFPEANVAINARAIASPARIVQFMGRVLRIAKNKPFAVLIEVAWQIKGRLQIVTEEMDEDTESGSGGNGGESGDDDVLLSDTDSDKLGFLEALAQLGEPIDKLRSLCINANGENFDYSFGVSALRKQPSEMAKIIRDKYQAQIWIDMTQKDRGDVKISGVGLGGIATVFGINSNPIGYYIAHLELGLKIWSEEGEDRSLIQSRLDNLRLENDLPQRQERLRGAIKDAYTSQTWANLTQVERHKVKFYGKKLRAIATAFGIKGHPIKDRLYHLELGVKVWETNEGDRAYLEAQIKNLQEQRALIAGLSGESLRTKLIELTIAATSVDEWLSMNPADKLGWRVAGLGMTAVARIFDVAGKPIATNAAHLDLGRKIWAADIDALAKITAKQESADLRGDSMKLAVAIRETYTADQWVKMGSKARGSVKVGEIGIAEIASAFGYKGKPQLRDDFLDLGLHIWSEGEENRIIRTAITELKETQDPILLRKRIQAAITAQEWIDMNPAAKLAFEIHDIGITAIAKVFGVTGDPLASRKVHLELGLKIWEDVVDAHRLVEKSLRDWESRNNPEVIIEELKRMYSPEAWIAMSAQSGLGIVVNEMGIRAIASLLGLTLNPGYTRAMHLDIGEKIWCDDLTALEQFKAARAALEAPIDKVKLKNDIKALKTPQAWIAMKVQEIVNFKVNGLGITAIATALDIDREHVKTSGGFLELGLIIWEDEPVHKQVIQTALDKLKAINSVETLRKAIKEQINVQTWLDTPTADRGAIKVGKSGLAAIAKAFGMTNGEVRDNKGYFKLATLIWADEPEALASIQTRIKRQELSEDKVTLRTKIKANLTAEGWIKMKKSERATFKIDGIAIIALGTIFGVDGRPLSTTRGHLELGQRIWEDDPKGLELITAAINALDASENPSKLREKIKQQKTPNQWVEMKSKDRLAFKVDGIGLTAIASTFGIWGNPIAHVKTHLELGVKIWQDEPALLSVVTSALEHLRFTSDKEAIRAALRASLDPEVAKEWAYTVRSTFKLKGMGLEAIARAFDLKGDPVKDIAVYRELIALVWQG